MMKKTWKQLLKGSFTKTFDERYAEASRNERIGYWIYVIAGFGIMFLMWHSK